MASVRGHPTFDMRYEDMYTTANRTALVGVAVVGVAFFFFQAEDGIRDLTVTGVQTCALPIYPYRRRLPHAQTYVRVDLVRRPGRTDVVADAAALPFADASFECVVATEVLE